MNNLKKYLPWIIRLLIAFLFLLSAVAKLYPSALTALGTFEAKQLIPIGFSEDFAPYFSRLLIGAEFAIGLAILFPYYLKKFVIPVAVLLLLIFCFQLSYDIITKGPNAGNCGCFGDLIPMTPLEALIKNILAVGLLVWLYRLLPSPGNNTNFATLIIIYLVFALGLFALAPIQLSAVQVDLPAVMPTMDDFIKTNDQPEATIQPDENSSNNTVKVEEKLTPKKEDKPKVDDKPKIIEPKSVASKFSQFPNYIPSAVNIDEGRKILCLFAPGCEHCQATAKELTEMRAKDPNFPPIHIVFMDEGPELIPEFFKIAGRTYSYRIAPVVDFWKIIDFSRDTPGVVYLWNGNIRYFSDGINDKAFDKVKFKKELDKVE